MANVNWDGVPWELFFLADPYRDCIDHPHIELFRDESFLSSPVDPVFLRLERICRIILLWTKAIPWKDKIGTGELEQLLGLLPNRTIDDYLYKSLTEEMALVDTTYVPMLLRNYLFKRCKEDYPQLMSKILTHFACSLKESMEEGAWRIEQAASNRKGSCWVKMILVIAFAEIHRMFWFKGVVCDCWIYHFYEGDLTRVDVPFILRVLGNKVPEDTKMELAGKLVDRLASLVNSASVEEIAVRWIQAIEQQIYQPVGVANASEMVKFIVKTCEADVV